MSSESENNTLNRLLGSQKRAAEEIQEIPYQPTVYAIPKDHWELMLSQLGQQTEFQEKLYQVMKRMPTAQGMTNCINSKMLDSEQTITRQTSEVKELLRQVGKSREEFTSRLSSQLSESRQEMLKAIDTLNKRLKIYSIAVLSISVVLSVLVWVLLSHLLK
ncbi:MAG: hypothetical protein K6F27_03690 [Ruminococcus sp.]|nr:hypothetical protein [Ruminococcus sp.]